MSYYKKGMILKLKNDERKYVIFEHSQKENKEYMLLTEFEGQIDVNNRCFNNVKIDYNKLFMIYYDNEIKKFSFENNDNILKELIEKSFNANN